MRRLTESLFKNRKKQRGKSTLQLASRQRQLLRRSLISERLESRQLLAGDVWNNEFHYDNIGTDTNEFVEVAGVAGADLSGHQIVLYNSFVDSRSDDKGPEPKRVTITTIGSSTYAFIGLERTNDVVVFDIMNPQPAHFVTNIRMPGDVSPEGLTIISAADSPLGYDMIVVTNEISQTVSTFALAPALSLEMTQSSIEEGQTATIGRVTRQGDTSADFIVTLDSADLTELTVPATVTIPAGSSFVDFDITGVDDGDVDGNVGANAFVLQNRESGEFVSPIVQLIDANSVLLTFGGPFLLCCEVRVRPVK